MNNANPAGIQNAANQIQSVVNSANSLVETIENACENLLNANSLLTSYSGQIVAGTKEPYYKQVTNEETGEVREVRLGDKADFWTRKLNGYVEDNVGRVKDYANEINNIVTSLNSEAIGMDRVAEAIDGYINSVESSIINGVGPTYLSADVLSNAFKAIGQESASKGNLARSGSDVNSGNLLDYSEIESTGLANTKLSFVLQDDGSYKVYSNGKETEYYTTALAAAFYQKTLKTLVNSNSSNTSSDTTSTETNPQGAYETYKVNDDGSYEKYKVNDDGSVAKETYDKHGSFERKITIKSDAQKIDTSNTTKVSDVISKDINDTIANIKENEYIEIPAGKEIFINNESYIDTDNPSYLSAIKQSDGSYELSYIRTDGYTNNLGSVDDITNFEIK